MTATVKITCDGQGCKNVISNEANGSTDDVSSLMEWHEWRNDPTTDEYQYCAGCWPAVRAEYEDMHEQGELSSNG
ncbi:hypothetical protein [Colwellia psychrerythraea]|uniref:Uncharacterized protein n=1 Tax=Colwellia psychrerythraea TaxID=28229 RepID=A0A099KNX0_COLPS|nr:hypothetical protein [Colwellia psychrerythraea]KGJ92151.1 hypothetical protein ND2E_3044 [Colwellia psychrerythraea]